MTERIQALKRFQWERLHHAARIALPEDLKLIYRDKKDSDALRTAKRLKQALELETPYIFDNELIAFTRTVPNLPRIFDDGEWAAITESHFIHELGNVSNLSPDYGRVIAAGLLAIREKLGDGEEHAAMRMSIDAVLDLTKRYEAAAREKGYDDLADTLARVPALSAAHLPGGAAIPAHTALRHVVRGGLSQHAGPLRPVHVPVSQGRPGGGPGDRGQRV